MGLEIHNSLSRQKEPFRTLVPGAVSMYVCGPNLYGPAHVGHALSYIFFDVVRRYLEYKGLEVRHVQNFTDIEDRIVARAQEEGRSIFAIAQEYIERFLQEMDALRVQRAHHYPRATEVIPKMIEIIEGLITGGHAYTVDGDVYFRVTSFPRYGLLSGRSLEQMQAGARIEVDERKEHPMDFALWKASRPGEPSWESPWGQGRPGWHIECSAMSMQFLGEQIDLHGGGDDVRFPHHENEIAQSEAYTGRAPFARFWVHNALMKPPVGDEMHRHLGNFVAIRDALARYEPDAIRLFVLSAHYRTPSRWTDEAVDAAGRGLERLRAALANADTVLGGHPVPSPDGPMAQRASEIRTAFERAMDDDFGTPQAIAVLFDLAAEINRAAGAAMAGNPGASGGMAQAASALRTLAGVLGLRVVPDAIPPEAAAAVFQILDEMRAADPALFPGEGSTPGAEEAVALLLSGRSRAREARRFALADLVRARLGEAGIAVEDLPGGSRWRLVSRRDARA
ncbi:MAG: cysteine--tRNA ligase [Armatimonadetes bacterium]|nr:cysteine--tRNA ligase [Armatimonadota bacterium]